MNDQEKQYYENLRLSRLEDQQSQNRKKEEGKEGAGEEMAGKAAGQAAQKAAIASGVGAPLAFVAKKVGEKAGKKIYKKRKILIITAIILTVIPSFVIIIGSIVLISVMFYAIVCSQPIGWLADKALDLVGKGFCQ